MLAVDWVTTDAPGELPPAGMRIVACDNPVTHKKFERRRPGRRMPAGAQWIEASRAFHQKQTTSLAAHVVRCSAALLMPSNGVSSRVSLI